MLRDINWNGYEKELHSSELPVLLCFFKNSVFHKETALSAEELSWQFQDIRFYVVSEEEHLLFFVKFQILGTPIFIFLVNGIERGRILGTVSTDKLRNFIKRNLATPSVKDLD